MGAPPRLGELDAKPPVPSVTIGASKKKTVL